MVAEFYPHSTRVVNGTDNGDVAEYHCDAGFETENQTAIVLSKCLQSGLWEKPASCRSNYM